MVQKLRAGSLHSFGLAALAWCCACSSGHPELGGAGGNQGTAGAGAVSGSAGATFQVGDAGPALDAASCASVSERAIAEKRPVDIIFVIDNSGSMSEEIAAVEARINNDFARILEASGADFRVILVSRYGVHEKTGPAASAANDICIRAPLGASDCTSPVVPASLNVPPRFYQYNQEITSQDAWCKLLDGWRVPDGWAAYLRPEAFKSIVIISDDDNACATVAASQLAAGDLVKLSMSPQAFIFKDPGANALRFDAALRELSQAQFGTATRRNYRVHSIVGMVKNAANNGAWPPSAPLQTERCGSDVDAPGQAHQSLSILTGGLRFPICEHENFDVVFHALAADAIQSAELSCEWKIPSPPSGESFDSGRVNLEYFPAGGSAGTTIPKVAAPSDCGAGGGWYYDDEAHPSKLLACPATCQTLESDAMGALNIAFGCSTIVDVR